MLYIVGILFILFIVTISVTFLSRFTLVLTDGESMSPTLKDGQLLIMDRRISPRNNVTFQLRDDLVGRVFVFTNPVTGENNIKRLIRVKEIELGSKLYWFEGDNKDNSFDSRNYGYITSETIRGAIVPPSDVIKRIFKPY